MVKLFGFEQKLKSPRVTAAKAAIDISRSVSNDFFGYDFVSLLLKLFIFFTVAFVFAKFMEAVIFTRGAWITIANLLGFQIPKSSEIPDSLKKLFDGGISGFKYWDVIKVVASILVIAELFQYVNKNRMAGSSSSPITIGLFVLIITVLTVVTVPDLFKRIKGTDFNLESLR